MLVLKRKVHSAVLTNTGLRLEVVEIGQWKARLFIRGNGISFSLWLGIGEAVQIDGHIDISVCGIELGAVKLGIEAPAEVKVLREELQVLPDGVLLGTIWAGK